jgi:hypothetical protein
MQIPGKGQSGNLLFRQELTPPQTAEILEDDITSVESFTLRPQAVLERSDRLEHVLTGEAGLRAEPRAAGAGRFRQGD